MKRMLNIWLMLTLCWWCAIAQQTTIVRQTSQHNIIGYNTSRRYYSGYATGNISNYHYRQSATNNISVNTIGMHTYSGIRQARLSNVGASAPTRIYRRRAGEDNGGFGSGTAGGIGNPPEPGNDNPFGGGTIGDTDTPPEPGNDNPFGGGTVGGTETPPEPGTPIGDIPVYLLILLLVSYIIYKRKTSLS